MERVYIETNAINQAFAESITGREIRIALEDHGYHPAIGIHTIYELARTFLGPDKSVKGSQLFSILRDIDGSIVPPTGMLLEQEIIKLRTGSAVLPMLDSGNQAATRYEIVKLARGIFDSTAEKFIASRENERRTNESLENDEYLNHVRQVNRDNKSEYRNVRNFEDTLRYFDKDVTESIRRILRGKVSRSEAIELSQRLDSFPSLRSVVRANQYLCFIVIRNEVHPAYDRVDDFRHVIDASYCAAFLTNDGQLARTANYINQDISVITWNKVFRKVQSG